MSTPHRPRRPTLVAVAAVAVIAALAWVAVTHLFGGRPSAPQRTSVAVPAVTNAPSSSPSGATAAVVAGPDGDSSGVPTGYVDTPAVARAAAVGWVSSLGT